MSAKHFGKVPVMRYPDKNSGRLMKTFQNLIEEKHNIKFSDYWDFHKWTVDNVDKFWAEIWDFSGVISSKKYDKVIDLNLPMTDAEWFPGAKLNMAENLLKYKDGHVALICAGEDRDIEKVTYAEMYKESCIYASALRKLGVEKGDRVACYMSNRKEAYFAMIAVASIGAVWVAALPLLGSRAALSRFLQITPKVLITVDRFQNNKEEINMLPKIEEIVKGLPSLEKTIIVPSKEDSKLKNIDGINNSCFLDNFLEMYGDSHTMVLKYEQVSFSHPVFISFTSGTTGVPKAMLHGFGSVLVNYRDFWLHADATRDSVWFIHSPAGWSSWNMMAVLTFTGVTICLYEGYPYFLSATHTWDLVDDLHISHYFLPASTLDDLVKHRAVPGQNNHLTSLRSILSGGSIVKPAGYDFVYGKVKKEMAFSAIYGSTEVMGMCLVCEHTVPIYKGEIPVPCLGSNLECVDERGEIVMGEVGELLLTTPSPGLLVGLWNDKDKTLFRKTYFSKYPGKFAIGDHAVRNPVTRGFIICGRSDDTLKQRGTRFGSIEIYNILDTISEIRDSLCVAQYNKDRDERAVLFVKMNTEKPFDEQLVQKIKYAIENGLTKYHIPEVILQTSDIPRNASGKKMESIVKKIINNLPYNTETIVNPECLKNFINIPQLQNFLH